MSPAEEPARRDAHETVLRYREDVARLARQLCRHREDAADVTQSTLLKAVQHLDGFRWEASVRTWLHRITTNECRMLRRRKAPASLEGMLEAAALGGSTLALPDRGPSPEEVAEEAETRRLVLRALAELPEHYRAAVLLKDGLGLSAEQVARATGTSIPAAKATLHRARRTLRERLRRALGEG